MKIPASAAIDAIPLLKDSQEVSVVHHAGRRLHTDACTTWNEEGYATSAVHARRQMDDIKSNIRVWLV
jgi:hypothetical protein